MTARQSPFCAYNLNIEHICYKKKGKNVEESEHYITNDECNEECSPDAIRRSWGAGGTKVPVF
jgi:hypothetical protein